MRKTFKYPPIITVTADKHSMPIGLSLKNQLDEHGKNILSIIDAYPIDDDPLDTVGKTLKHFSEDSTPYLCPRNIYDVQHITEFGVIETITAYANNEVGRFDSLDYILLMNVWGNRYCEKLMQLASGTPAPSELLTVALDLLEFYIYTASNWNIENGQYIIPFTYLPQVHFIVSTNVDALRKLRESVMGYIHPILTKIQMADMIHIVEPYLFREIEDPVDRQITEWVERTADEIQRMFRVEFIPVTQFEIDSDIFRFGKYVSQKIIKFLEEGEIK